MSRDRRGRRQRHEIVRRHLRHEQVRSETHSLLRSAHDMAGQFWPSNCCPMHKPMSW
jgi:hypothetical protein